MPKKVEDKLLDHDFDGIKEFDNPLPPWWVGLFYLTIIISLVYILYYHVSGFGPSQREEYLNEINSFKNEKLCGKTLLGSSHLALDQLNDLQNLILSVASKGGTTEEGLKQLESYKLNEMLLKANNLTIKPSSPMGKMA